jgi:hypothetical protein
VLTYAGHLWHRGWTVLDVTDPAKPTVANFIPGPENTWTIQMEIGGDRTSSHGAAPKWEPAPEWIICGMGR